MNEPPERADGQCTKTATSQTWHPVNLDLATTKSQYITGYQALNLWDRQSGPNGGTADWHEPAALWTLRPSERGDHTNVNIVVPNRSLGEDGVEDAHKALRGPKHPGAGSPVPIWKATHARAVVDIAFHRCRRGERILRESSLFGPIAPWTVADWMWTENQMETVRSYAQRAEAEVAETDGNGGARGGRACVLPQTSEDYIKA